MGEICEKSGKNRNWFLAKPKKSDFIAGLVVGLICVALLGSIVIANCVFIGN